MTSRLRLLPLVALGLLGCRRPPDNLDDPTTWIRGAPRPGVNAVASPRLAARSRRLRVLVLPLRHHDPGTARAVTQALALELEQLQAVEVVSAYGAGRKMLSEWPVWDTRGLDLEALVSLRRRFRIDALVLGKVTQYRAYNPPTLGLRVQMVSTRSGAVLWGAEACFDARQSGVREMLVEFYGRQLRGDGREYGWQVLLDSPRHYAQFVAHEVVATLQSACRAPTGCKNM